MSLDINFTQRKKKICPHCGKFVDYADIDCVGSGGRAWYPFLESIGYYVPYEQRTEENDWYGKDMVLTEEQAKKLYKFVSEQDVYNDDSVKRIIAVALLENDEIVVNADW